MCYTYFTFKLKHFYNKSILKFTSVASWTNDETISSKYYFFNIAKEGKLHFLQIV